MYVIQCMLSCNKSFPFLLLNNERITHCFVFLDIMFIRTLFELIATSLLPSITDND